MAEPRSPISLPTYAIGVEAKPNHFAPSTPRETAAEEAKSLAVGDAAFILRSGHKWSYAIVTEKSEEGDGMLRFEVDKAKSRKSFPGAVWGKYIRMIKVDESEMAKLEAEESVLKAGEEAKKAKQALKEEEEASLKNKKGTKKKKENKAAQNTDKKSSSWGEITKGVSSVFSSFSGPSKKTAKSEIGTCALNEKEKNGYKGTKSKQTEEINATATEACEATDTQAKREVETVSENMQAAKKDKQVKASAKTNKKSLPWGEFSKGASSLFASFPGPFEKTGKSEGHKDIVTTEEEEPAVVESRKTEETEGAAAAAPAARAEEGKKEKKTQTGTESEKTEEIMTASVASPTNDTKDNDDKISKEDARKEPRKEEVAKYEEIKAKDKTDNKPLSSPWAEFTNGVSCMLSSFASLSNTMGQTEEGKHVAVMEAMDEIKPKSIESKKTEEIGPDENSKAPSPHFALPAPEESRDDVEEQAATARASPAAPKGTIISKDPIEPLKPPIKLLETPLQFYKASTMREDPALAALDATSFCDDHNLEGVVVCENDPASGVVAEALARKRLYYSLERQDDVVVETEMKKQGITIVRSPKQGTGIDECPSVETEKGGAIAAEAE